MRNVLTDNKKTYLILALLSLAIALTYHLLRNEPVSSDLDIARMLGAAAMYWLVSSFFVKYWSPRAGYIALCVFIVLGYAGLYAD